MRFSVAIPLVYHHLPLIDGLAEAGKAGMKHAEIMRWYDEDMLRLKKVKDELKMEVVMLSTRSYQLADSRQHPLFLQQLAHSIEAAKMLDCRRLLCIVGDEIPGVSRELQKNEIISVLKESARMLETHRLTLHIEPLNTKIDHPGYFLSSSDEAFEIVRAVGSPNVKVVFDFYHQQITEGDLCRRVAANMECIGHFHAAGHPGRHELTTGEIHYPYIFNMLAQLNYEGFVGLEYIPQAGRDIAQEIQHWLAFERQIGF
jgi:hydroxypyruvate isomerase